MSQLASPIRFGPPTTATVLADLSTEGSILSRRVADVETSVRKLAQLATTVGASAPTPGYHGTLVYPEQIDSGALAGARDESLRDALRRIDVLRNQIAGLLGPR